MFEAILAKFLNKLLGKYVANLENKQLEVAVWKGDVKMTNLLLQKDAFQEFDLPFRIDEGVLESLVIEIPWKSIKTEPIRIFIKGLRILSIFKRESQFSYEEEVEKAFKRKLALVESHESWRALKAEASGEPSQESSSFLGSLVTRLVNNVQVTIEDISIVLRDLQGEKFPYEMQMKLENLQIFTTDSQWREHFEANIKQSLHKLLKVKSFSLSIHNGNSSSKNHLIEPINASVKVILNKKIDASKAKTEVEIDFEDLSVTCNEYQIGSILELVATFVKIRKQRKFCKGLPKVPISADPLAWMQFCVQSVREMVNKKRSCTITSSYLIERRRNRLSYMSLYSKILLKAELTVEEKATLQDLHRKLSEADILYFRTLSRSLVSFNAAQGKSSGDLQLPEAPKGFFGWILGRKSEAISSSNVLLPLLESSEETEQFFREFAKDELDIFGMENVFISDALRLKVTLNLHSSSFSLSDEKNAKLMDFSLSDFKAFGEIYTKKRNFGFEIKDVVLETKFETSSFPYLLQRLQCNNSDECPMITASFAYDPIVNQTCPLSMQFSVAPIQLILCKDPIDSFMNLVRKSQYHEILDQLLATWSSKINDNIRNISRFGLEMAFSKEKGFNFELSLSQTSILIPDNLYLNDSFLYQLSFSFLNVKSLNFAEARKKFFSELAGVCLTEEQIKRLHSIIYDNLMINARDLCLKFYDQKSKFHRAEEGSILVDCSAPLQMELGLLVLPPGTYKIPKCKATVVFSNTLIAFSSKKFHALMKTIDNFLNSFPDEDLRANGTFNLDFDNESINLDETEDFFDVSAAPEQTSNFVIPVELFETVHPLEVTKFQLQITIKDAKASLCSDLNSFADSFSASVVTEENVFVEVCAKPSRVIVGVSLSNYSLLMNNSINDGEEWRSQSIIKSEGQLKVKVDYHSFDHPHLESIFKSQKLKFYIDLFDSVIVWDSSCTQKIVQFALQTFSSDENIYNQQQQQKEKRDKYFIFLQLQLLNTKVLLNFPQSSKCQFYLLVPIFDFQLVHGVPSRGIIKFEEPIHFMTLLDTGIGSLDRLDFEFSLTAEEFSGTLQIKGLNSILIPDDLYSFFHFICCSFIFFDDGKKAGPSSRKASLVLDLFDVSLDLPLDSTGKGIRFNLEQLRIENSLLKFTNIFLQSQNAKLARLSSPFCLELSISSAGPLEVRKIHAQSSTDIVFSFDEDNFYLLLNRLQTLGICLVEAMNASVKDRILFPEQQLKNSLTFRLSSGKKVIFNTFADGFFLGTLEIDKFAYYLSHFSDGEIASEASASALTMKNSTLDSVATSSSPMPVLMSFNLKDSGMFLQVELAGYTFSCPMFFFMKMKQVYLDWSAREPYEELCTLNAVKRPIKEGQFCVDISLSNVTLAMFDHSKRSLQFKTSQCSLIKKGTDIVISLPHLNTIFQSSPSAEPIQILNKFTVTTTISYPTPLAQIVTLDLDPINMHYSHLDFSLLNGILMQGFLVQPPFEPQQQANIPSRPSNYEQKAIFNFKGINVFFVEDKTPLFTFKVIECSIEVFNWSLPERLTLFSTLSFKGNMFNLNTTAWEPFIEPSKINLEIKQSESKRIIKAHSDSMIDFNFAACHAQWFTSILSYLKKDKQISELDIVSSACRVQNLTGFDLMIWNDSSKQQRVSYLEDRLIYFQESEESFLLRQEIQLKTLSVHLIDSTWETLHNIFIIKEGIFVCDLNPTLDAHLYKLVVQISVQDGVKVICFRSVFRFFNDTNFPIELAVRGQRCKIAPQSFGSLRIQDSKNCQISLCPLISENERYQDSESVSMKQLKKEGETSILLCNSISNPDTKAYLSLVSQTEQDSSLVTIHINYPLLFFNLLPYPISFSITDHSLQTQVSCENLAPGDKRPFYQVNIANLLKFQSQINCFDGKVLVQEGIALISVGNETAKFEVSDRAEFVSSFGENFIIHFDYGNSLSGGRLVYIYCPVLVYNRTEMPLYMRSTMFIPSSPSANSSLDSNDKLLMPHNETDPLLFSGMMQEDDVPPNNSFSIDRRNWKELLSLDRVGSRQVIDLKDEFDACGMVKNLLVEVSIGSGIYFNTTVVEIVNRFLIHNLTSFDLEYSPKIGKKKQEGQFVWQPLAACSSSPFHPIQGKGANNCQIFLKVNDKITAINISSATTVLFPLNANTLARLDYSKKDLNVMHLVLRQEANWPFQIINETTHNLILGQKNCDIFHEIAPQSQINYTLDDPYASHTVYTCAGNAMKEFVIDDFGAFETFRAQINQRFYWLSIEVKTSGPAFLIVIREHESESGSDSTPSRPTEVSADESQSSLTIVASFSDIGVSLYNNSLEEFLYARFSDVNACLVLGETCNEYSLDIRWIQIDNQLIRAKYPVCLCPKNLDIAQSYSNPFVHLFCKKIHTPSTTGQQEDFIHWEKVEFQLGDTTFNIDEHTFYQLFLFYKSIQSQSNAITKDYLIQLDRFLLPEKDSTAVASVEQLFYLDHLVFDAINLSFTFSPTAEMDEGELLKVIGFDAIIFKILATAQNARYEIPKLERQNWLVPKDLLITNVRSHYVNLQLKSIAFQTDLFAILEPFYHLSSGVTGFAAHVRPGNPNRNWEKGTNLFFRETGIGLSSFLYKYTNLLNRTLSSTTSGLFSQKYIESRNYIKNRNAPSKPEENLTIGFKSLWKSLSSAVTGIVDEPLEGAKENGPIGLIKGLFTGVTGVVSKPILGTIDMLTYTLKACHEKCINNTKYDKIRIPKVQPYDGILREYSIKEAFGQYLLRRIAEGKYWNAIYVAHIDIASEKAVCILHTGGLLMIELARASLLWEIHVKNVLHCRSTVDSILVSFQLNQSATKQASQKNRVILCPEDATRMWFLEMIREVMTSRIIFSE